MKPPRHALVAGVLVALLAIPLVVGFGPALMPAFLVDSTRGGETAAPPEVRLATPGDGDGVAGRVLLEGEGRVAEGLVQDIQFRLDGQRWASIPDLPRGLPQVPFRHELVLSPGDHVLEVRAYDGVSFSLPTRVTVRSAAVAPPTLHVLSPSDGDGARAGSVPFKGVVRSAEAPRIHLVYAPNRSVEATVVPGAAGLHTWTAEAPLGVGAHNVTVRAEAASAGLPRTVRVMTAASVPPTVRILTPEPGAAYGSRGDAACDAPCVLLTGAVRKGDTPVERVLVELDGAPMPEAGTRLDPFTGAWSARLALQNLYSGEHRAAVTAVAADGTRSAPQTVAFHVRSTRTMAIAGDDAPRPTGTPLRFTLAAAHLEDVAWRLDGAPAGTGSDTVVTLATPGDHLLEARATTADGRAATARVPLYAVNRAPIATLSGETAFATTETLIRAEAVDPDGHVARYHWEFGDGDATDTTSPLVTHRYGAAGLYRVNLTPFDDLGLGGPSVSILLPITNAPPVAAFSWDPPAPRPGEPVTLRDSSHDPDGRIVARTWFFPDGTRSEAPAPTHRFALRGPQSVLLRVMDNDGASAETALEVPVANVPATVRFHFTPELPQTATEVLFTDLSLKPDGRIVGWRWDFGDGATSHDGPAALHAYRSPGEYEVRLEVLDDLGARANASLRLLVADSFPVIRQVVVTPDEPLAHDEVQFRAVAYDREGSILGHEWSFGDNTTSSLATPAHRYARSGLYQGRLTVVDEAGQSTSIPFAVLVGNAPPTVGLTDPLGGYAAFPTLLRAEAQDADGRLASVRFDADGDGLDDCDGDALECSFTYLRPGVYPVTVRVRDDEGAEAVASRAIEVRAPPSGLAPPGIVVDAPLPRAFLRGEQMLSGTAGGVRPVAAVEAQLRNGSWAFALSRSAWMAAEGNATWRLLLDTRAFPDGPYDLVVRATDTAGGVGFATVPVTLANGERESRVDLRLLDRPKLLTEDTLVRGSAWHPEGITSVRWRLDEGAWRFAEGPAIAFGVPLARADVKPGEHRLTVTAYRGLAESREETLTFRVPGEAPLLLVDEPPTYVAYGLLHASGRVLGSGHVEWRLDHGVWQPIPGAGEWRLDRLTHDLPAGNHTLTLRAVSPDGSLASEPRAWRVHLVNPAGDAVRRAPDAEAATQTGPRVETPLDAPVALAALGLALLLRRFGALPPRI